MAGNIKGITIEIGGNTTKLEKALRNVNNSGRDLNNQLKDIEKSLKFNPGNSELLAQRQRALAESVQNTKDKLNTLKEAHRQAQQQLANGKIGQDEFDALTREIIRAENQLNRFERQMHQANSTMYKMGEGVQKFGEGTKKLGEKLMPVSLATAGIGALSVKTAADFESAMSQVSAISGATGNDLNALKDKAKEMGMTTKFSAKESADALKYMAMAGWDTKKMLDGLPGVMNLAAASGEELGTVSDIVTDAMTAFGLKADQAGHFADVLAMASSKSNTNVSLLGESFKYAAPLAGAMGYSVEDVGTALGIMANAGIKGSEAGTTLRSALTRLASPTKDVVKGLNMLGLEVKDVQGLSLDETLMVFRNSFKKLDKTQKAQASSMIFGKTAMSGMLAVINASDKDYEGLLDNMYKADGAAKKMADTMNDNLNGQIILLKSALEALAIKIGDILLPFIKELVTHIQNFVDFLNGLSPAAQSAIVAVGGLIAIAGPLLIVIGQMSIGVGALMKVFSMFGAATTATTVATAGAGASMGGLGAVMTALTGPIGIIVGLIVALGATFVIAYKNNEEFRKNVHSAWKQIQDFISNAIKAIQNVITTVLSAIKSLWDRHKNELLAVVTALWDLISAVIKKALDAIKALFEAFTKLGKAIWSNFGTSITYIFKALFDGLNKIISGALNIIKGIITAWTGIVNGDFKKFSTGIKSIVSGMWQVIKGIFETAIKAILGVVSGLITGVSRVMGETKEKAIAKAKEFLSVGTNIVNGIINGITAEAKKLWDAGVNIINNLLGGAKSRAQIKSPSRVFENEVGKQVVAGTAQGMIKHASILSEASDKVHKELLKTEKNNVLNLNRQIEALDRKIKENRAIKRNKANKAELNSLKLHLIEEKKLLEQQKKEIEAMNTTKYMQETLISIHDKMTAAQKLHNERMAKLNEDSTRESKERLKKYGLEEITNRYNEMANLEKEKILTVGKQIEAIEREIILNKATVRTKANKEQLNQKAKVLEAEKKMLEQDKKNLTSYSDAFAKTFEKMQADYQKAFDAIESKQNSLAEKLKSFGQLMETIKTDDGKEILKLGDIKGQISTIKQYGDVLDGLKRRGADADVISNVLSMGVEEAVKYGNLLLQQSQSDFETYNKLMAEKRRVATEVASKAYATEFLKLKNEQGLRMLDLGITTGKQWDNIKTKMITPVEQARKHINTTLKNIENSFKNMKLTIPKPKIPKIDISYSRKGGVSIPNYNVSWYDKGGIFSRPSIIGVGEKRPEFVGALDDLRNIVADVIDNRVGQGNTVFNVNFNGDMQVRSDDDIRRLAREIGDYVLSQNRAFGEV
nr:MAG TPA: minor tail protein [Caudoviricetes sp.]